MRRVLVVGGAPRVRIDAVRHLIVHASGATALGLRDRLHSRLAIDLLLGADAAPGADASRFTDRPQLESALGAWIAQHRDGVVVMSAAINDYDLHQIERVADGRHEVITKGAKIASGADEVVIRLRPADKLIDRLRPEFGLEGPIIGFKYEDRTTVIDSAQRLLQRVGAALVVANSLCGEIQALVGPAQVDRYQDRGGLLDELANRIAIQAGSRL